MTRLISLLDASVRLDDLASGLSTHMQASGLALPEDRHLIDTVAIAARYGELNAVLAAENGTAVGIVVWRLEGNTGYLRLLYVLPGTPDSVARDLLACAMRGMRVRATGGIYGELPEVPPPVRDALVAQGFVGVQRFLMCADLSTRDWTVALPAGYALTAWDNARLDQAAQVIYRANEGSLDALLIPELRSYESTRAIVRQTLFGQYGDFDPQASGLVITAGDELVAVTLATRRSGGEGFTAEICVSPDHRRRGLARALMHHTHGVFRAAGVVKGLLGVTAGNPARLLYESLSYREVGSVWTYIWPRPAGWEHLFSSGDKSLFGQSRPAC